MSDKTFQLDQRLSAEYLESLPEGAVIYDDQDCFYLKEDDGSWTFYTYGASDAYLPKRGDLVGVIRWDEE